MKRKRKIKRMKRLKRPKVKKGKKDQKKKNPKTLGQVQLDQIPIGPNMLVLLKLLMILKDYQEFNQNRDIDQETLPLEKNFATV